MKIQDYCVVHGVGWGVTVSKIKYIFWLICESLTCLHSLTCISPVPTVSPASSGVTKTSTRTRFTRRINTHVEKRKKKKKKKRPRRSRRGPKRPPTFCIKEKKPSRAFITFVLVLCGVRRLFRCHRFLVIPGVTFVGLRGDADPAAASGGRD